MKSTQARALLLTLSALDVTRLAERQERLAAIEAEVMRQGDPLFRAEFVVYACRLAGSWRPLAEVMSRLYEAAKVLAEYRRHDLEAEAYVHLARYQVGAGRSFEALCCAERAMSGHALPVAQRLEAAGLHVAATGNVQGLQAAWRSCAHWLDPCLAAVGLRPDAAPGLLAKANLHLMQAVAEAGLVERWSLAQEAGLPAVQHRTPAMLESLGAVESLIAEALRVRPEAVHWTAAYLRSAVAGLKGQLTDAVRLLDVPPRPGVAEAFRLLMLGWLYRVNARFEQARPLLEQALARAVEEGAMGCALDASLSLAVAEEELGHHRAASQHLKRCLELMALESSSGEPAGTSDGDLVRPASPGDRPAPTPALIQKVQEVMRAHLSPRLSLTALAQACGVRPRTLQAAVLQHLGCSVSAAYRAMALQRACELLARTQQPVAKVAQAVGLASAPTFSRLFKHRYGVPRRRIGSSSSGPVCPLLQVRRGKSPDSAPAWILREA